MKWVDVPDVNLGTRDMEAALHRVFGLETLRKVHGPDLKAGEFDAKGRRSFEFTIDVSDIPPPVRAFFCKPKLLIRTRQQLSKPSPTRWEVSNKLKMHFVGAELFKIRPSFWLSARDDGVYLGGRVRHDAVLPPPLNGICERFMALQTWLQLDAFAKVLADPAKHEGALQQWRSRANPGD